MGLGSLIPSITPEEEKPNIGEDQKSLSQRPSNQYNVIYVIVREKMVTLPLSSLATAHNSSQFLFGVKKTGALPKAVIK